MKSKITEKQTSWFQKVVLRGIEGMLADQYLLQLATSHGNVDSEVYQDYMEASNMAQQVYAQVFGWGL